MTVALIEQINSLDDANSVNFLQHFNQMLANGITNDFDEMLTSVPASVRELPEFTIVEDLASGETKRELTEQESIELSKKILEILGQNPDLLPLLEHAWKTWKGNNEASYLKQPLSATLAALATIFVVTSDVSFDDKGNFHFHKTTEGIEQVAPLIVLFGKMFSPEQGNRERETGNRKN